MVTGYWLLRDYHNGSPPMGHQLDMSNSQFLSPPLTKAVFSALLFILSAAVVRAGEILTPIMVTPLKKDGSFDIEVRAQLNTSPPAIFSLVTDYDNLHVLSTSILSSRVTDTLDDHTTLIALQLQICIFQAECDTWRFRVAALLARAFGANCYTFEQRQTVTVSPPASLHVEIRAEGSNGFAGSVDWHFTPAGTGTRVDFHATLTPRFWVPPFFGPLLIECVLQTESQLLFAGLEQCSAGLSPINR